MKTIEQCKSDLCKLQKERSELIKLDKKTASIKKKIENVVQCIEYLRTSPTDEFLRKEAKNLEKMVKTREEAANEKYSGRQYEKMEKKTLTKLKNKLLAELGTAKLRLQLATVKYLLDGK